MSGQSPQKQAQKQASIQTGFILYITILVLLLFYSLIFINGVFGTSFFNSLILNPILAGQAQLQKARIYADPYPPVYWIEAADVKGVQAYKQDKAVDGYTLYVTAQGASAYLVDMKGEIAHQWALPFYSAWPAPDHIANPAPETHIMWRRARVMPNGDLIAIYCGVGDMVLGYGMVRINKDSKVIWQYNGHTHHDFDMDAAGNIFVLDHDLRADAHPLLPQMNGPFIEDFLVILDDGGQPLQKISLIDAFADTPYADILSHVSYDPGGDLPAGDILHPNTVEIVRNGLSGAHDFLKPGYVMISFRNISLLAVIDPGAGKVVWASYGPWRHQHDPDVLSDGHILLFDNDGYAGPGGASRLIEVDPSTMAINWQYTGDKAHPFYSQYMGSQQRLANGNTLVSSSGQARIFEITRAGEIVWDYRVPQRSADGKLMPIVFGARRYVNSDLPFLQSER